MYPLLFRTVLTRFDPETAHHAGMLVVRLAGVRPLAWIARALTRPDPALRTRALGLEFATPFGIAAGFDKNAVGALGLGALGFGHVEIGTVTAVPQDGNPSPRLFRLTTDRALINRMGFNNEGADAAAIRLRRIRSHHDRPIIGANIGKSRVVDVEDATADYVRSARLLAPVADYLAVNVSSPNTPGLRTLQAVETLAPLLQAVKDAAGTTPLLVKIAPDLSDDEVVAVTRLAVDLGLAGLIAANTTVSRQGLRTESAIVEAAGAGGLSGAPVRRRARDVVALARATAPDPEFCIIGVGGVETAADVRALREAGATLVQGYTGFIYRGPLWARQLNRALAAAR